MRSFRTVFALAGAALAMSLAAAGCSSPCQDLGDRVCNCQPAGATQTACRTDVKNRINAAHPSGDEQSYCSNLLKTCPEPPSNWTASSPPPQCALLDTCQGKVNCGLALPQPEPDGGASGGICVPITPVELPSSTTP